MDQATIDEIKKGDLVYVLWEDSTTDHGWASEDDSDFECLDVESVGFVISVTAKRLKLGADRSQDPGEPKSLEYNRKMVIPRSIIKEVRKL